MLCVNRNLRFTRPKVIRAYKDDKTQNITVYEYSSLPSVDNTWKYNEYINKYEFKREIRADIGKWTFLKILAEEDRDMFIDNLTEEELLTIWRDECILYSKFISILKERCILNNDYFFYRYVYLGESRGEGIIYPPTVYDDYRDLVKIEQIKAKTKQFYSKGTLPTYRNIYVIVNRHKFESINLCDYFLSFTEGKDYIMSDDYYR